MQSNTKKMFHFGLDFFSDYLPYIGLVLAAVLVVQAQMASHISEETLSNSVARQEALRNILWSNLMLQRVEVLALRSNVKNDPELRERASGVLDSIPNFFAKQTNLNREYQKLILNETAKLKGALDESVFSSTQADLFLEEVEGLGVKLNEFESKEWFNLSEQNLRLLEDFKRRQFMATITYAIFALYLLFLGWITSRKKQAELFLKQSEKKARVLSDASFEGLAIIKDDLIIEVNPAFERLFELRAAEAIGKKLDSFFAKSPFGIVPNAELIATRPDGVKVPVEISVRDSVVEDVGITIVAIRDLSDKKLSENFKQEKEAAEEANKAKSIFLANMSHELRTPMHGVLSFARFGMRDSETSKNEKLKDYFVEIFESGSRLMQLLNDLLDLAKLESGKMEYHLARTDLMQVCDQVTSEMSAFASEKKLKLITKWSLDQDFGCMMDKARIAQVLCNIVSNAIKFSLPETEIVVELSSSNNLLTCSISNKGEGIPGNELESVFDKFVQSSKTRTGAGGTGLGLSICREIIIHHKGKIWAECNHNGLTSFIFTLPQMEAANVEVA